MASALMRPSPSPPPATQPTATRPAGCKICGDFGVIPLEGKPRGATLPEILANCMPCACPTGDTWREDFELDALFQEKPKCACGRPASPLNGRQMLCRFCFAAQIEDRRSNGNVAVERPRGGLVGIGAVTL